MIVKYENGILTAEAENKADIIELLTMETPNAKRKTYSKRCPKCKKNGYVSKAGLAVHMAKAHK